jgi:mRNA interferase MazF
MAGQVARGEIWQLDRPSPDHRRPVLVLSRPALLDLLQTVTVAAVTSTRRGVPTEVALGAAEGLKHESCVNLSNLYTIRKADLKRFVGVVGAEKMRAVCRALAIALGCD